MSTQIESAGVKKNGLVIDDEGRATVFSTVETEDRHVNKKDGTVWSLDVPPVTPAGIGDYFFYFENTGSVSYLITDFRFIGAAPTLLDIDCVSGTPVYVTGTDIVPLSRNTGKIPIVTAVIKWDTDITGLTDKGRFFPQQIEAAAKLDHLSTSSGITVEPGGAVAIKSSVATAIEGMVSIYEIE